MLSTRIFACFLLCVSVFLIFSGWSISAQYNYEPLGPKPFPIVSLFLIAFCSILLFFFAEDTKVSWGNLELWKKLVILVAVLFLFAGMFEYLGFIISACFLIFTMSLLFEARVIYSMVFAIFGSIGFYYFFENFLQITLPFGLIFE